MVADFSSLNPIGEWIRTQLDHATLVSEQDRTLLEWLLRNEQKHFVTVANPTSEILAKRIFGYAASSGFALQSVRVSETCTAAATYLEE